MDLARGEERAEVVAAEEELEGYSTNFIIEHLLLQSKNIEVGISVLCNFSQSMLGLVKRNMLF
jgi:hypothetical protein